VAFDWSIHQLTEYFEAVASQDNEFAAARGAIELAAEALGAELGALVRDGELLTCVGWVEACPRPTS
jgi:hypothetical protein